MRPIVALVSFLFLSSFVIGQTTVVDVIVNSEDHTTLETAVLAAGLEDDLGGDGPFTVFAPTDAAFEAVPAEALNALLADPTGSLTDVLLYHVLGAEVRSTDLMDGMTATTLNGKDISVRISNDSVFINDALVTMADIETDNGVVHVIDAVLLPPRVTVVDVIVNSENHTTLETAVLAAGLEDDLSGDGPFTVFAPTDAAFEAVPAEALNALLADPTGSLTDVLLYHVLGAEVLSTDLMDGMTATTLNGKDISVRISNDSVFINDALVTMADIETDNGVVHVIDAVLLPPRVTVVDVIVNSENHTTLETAVLAAGLEDDLSGDGPFTVFAPTDAAFEAVPAEALNALLADPTGSLTDVLLYHVLGAEVLSTDLMDGMRATTLNGKDISVRISNDSVFINDALVTMADIETDNGVVHVIDAVLLPPTTVWDVIAESEDHTTLETAVLAAGLDATLKTSGTFTVFAPTDAAFEAVPAEALNALLADPTGSLTDVLLYHVLGAEVRSTDLIDGMTATTLNGKDISVRISNDNVFINDALVTMADIETDNGVVHVIDAVLLPPTTVWDVIAESEDHTTLETAVLAAGLDATLKTSGTFTVFAPTDAAFEAVPAEALNALLADPTGSLTDVLLYHVLGAEVRSTDLMDGMTATTLNGKDISVRISNDSVFINDALVTMADIETDNGVVHVINAVLLPPRVTVVDVIVNSENHTTLETAVLAAGLEDDLSGDGPFTVFAPRDAAFEAVPAEALNALLADPTGSLTDVLLYHVLGAEVLSTDLMDGMRATTLNGKDISVRISNDSVFINDALVTMADIETDNGVVHVIDAVLLPPTTVWDVIAESEDHTTLETAVLAAGLDATLKTSGTFTVFAPTDAAFEAVPAEALNALLADPTGSLTDVLLYHVLGAEVRSTDLMDGMTATTLNGKDISVRISNDSVFINDALVTMADIETDNGVVHVIDAVLLPPTTVWDVIEESEDHTTLETAVLAAGLDATLKTSGTFTVFAPTDAAFAAVDADVLTALLADPEGDLSTVLLYHVLSGSVLSSDLSDGQMATTLQGEDLTVTIRNDSVFINNALVSMADIETDNGVVHVIDAVLLPLEITSTRSVEYEQIDVTVFPNPTTEKFTIDWKGNELSEGIVRMIDGKGRLINSWITTFNFQEFDAYDLAPGIYFLEITSGNKRALKQLVIK